MGRGGVAARHEKYIYRVGLGCRVEGWSCAVARDVLIRVPFLQRPYTGAFVRGLRLLEKCRDTVFFIGSGFF